MTIFKSLTFWTLVVGVIAFSVKFFVPEFPFDEAQILSFVLFVLGLAGIYPEVRNAMDSRLLGLNVMWQDLFLSREFWVLLVGLVSFVIFQFFPAFPFGVTELLALVLFILGLFQVNPELRARGLK